MENLLSGSRLTVPHNFFFIMAMFEVVICMDKLQSTTWSNLAVRPMNII